MSTSAFSMKLPNPLVFISHSSKDKNTAVQIVNMLYKENIEAWIDHNQINFGDSIPEKIEKGLECSDALLFIVSENSVSSNWCRAEYETFLMKEINSGSSLVIPILVGECNPPALLSRKLYMRISVSQNGNVIVDKIDFKKLCNSIKKTTSKERLVSLTYNKELKYHASLVAMIISSALKDFPVNTLYAEQIIQGKRMSELFSVVEKFIDEFDKLMTELIEILGNWKWYEPTSYIKIESTNRKLLSIHNEMKLLSDSMGYIAKSSNFIERFKEISEVCVKIEDCEGSHIFAELGIYNKKNKYDVLDVMPRDQLIEGKGHFEIWSDSEIIDLNNLLIELTEYKLELKKAMAKALFESE